MEKGRREIMATDSMTPGPATAPLPVVPPTPFLLPADWTLADLQSHLGGIPLERIRLYPPPGSATKADVEPARARKGRTCELIDGVLVEKTVGVYESVLGMWIGNLLGEYLKLHNVGTMGGEASTVELLPEQVRAADACVIRWERLRGIKLKDDPVPTVVPDLAIEVLSKGNTKAEMRRKLHEYFTAGVRLVWYIEPRKRTARAYTAEDQFVDVDENGSLSGGDVLPGFVLSLSQLFALADAQPEDVGQGD
jgi:Uma2 family endonuclease